MKKKIFKCKYCKGEHVVEKGWAYCPKVFGGNIRVRKRKVMRTKEPVTPHMKYNTYAVLRDWIRQQKEFAHRAYCDAANLTYATKYDGSTSPQFDRNVKSLPNSTRDFMWENYKKQMEYYEDMLKQLYYAAQESNRTHPNPEMRKFWLVQ